jgi:tetratricopeptide (TPR) repeat protein
MSPLLPPILRRALLASAVALLSACQSAADRQNAAAAAAPRLYAGFENYSRTVATTSREAQRFIDQGLQWLFGFNDDEAIRCFREAARLDPGCAFAWWGVAYAHGININDPVMSEAESRGAWDAIRQAIALREHARPAERALIDALAKRYAWPPPKESRSLEEAFAGAMADAWRLFPDDADVGAIYAESLMNLQPWDYWTIDGAPKGRATEIVGVLERVLQIAPDHPGALHYYIHAVEASQSPERAEAAADRLASLVPGSSHLTHMPSHIFARLGRYADAADANARAVAADRIYLASAPEQDYYGLYIAPGRRRGAVRTCSRARPATASRAP